jgi:hypothetical protein
LDKEKKKQNERGVGTKEVRKQEKQGRRKNQRITKKNQNVGKEKKNQKKGFSSYGK